MSESASRELARVRPVEEQEWPRLESYLKERMPGLEGPMEVLQFPRGAANLTYLLRFGPKEVVMRRPPFGPVAPGGHDMVREYNVLSRLWQFYDRAPRAYLLCEDPGVIGATFFVMERRTGVVVDGPVPEEMARHPDVERRVSFALVEAMAEFHALDPYEIGLGEIGKPTGFVRRQVSGWKKRWELAKDEDLPLFDAVYERLDRTIPDPTKVSLVHNDLKLDNCQFDPDRPDRVKSIFDWDMTTVGDPLIDLGTLLGYWPEAGDEENRNPRPGIDVKKLPRRREIAGRYSELTGVPVEQIRWYEAFALWKTAVVGQQIFIRYARGQTQDERFPAIKAKVPKLVELASDVLKEAGI
jgi:aminoglycoside phosphotransferase (APT) family kinase protein